MDQCQGLIYIYIHTHNRSILIYVSKLLERINIFKYVFVLFVGLRSGGPKLKSTQVYPAKFGRTGGQTHTSKPKPKSQLYLLIIYICLISLS